MSSDYVGFVIDLTGEGENRTVRETVRYRRDPKVRPHNAFQWKVVCDANGKVIVFGFVGGRPRVMATARWHGTLAEHKHRDPTTPTSYQWNLVEVAIREELARRASMLDRSGEAPLRPRDLIEDDVGFDAELAPAPMEVLAAPHDPILERELARARDRDDRYRTRMDRRRKTGLLAIGSGVVALAILIVFFVVTRTRVDKPKAVSAPVVPAPPSPAPPVTPVVVDEPVEVRVTKAASFTEAIALSRPAMADTAEALGGGKQQLATYAAHKLRWADVDVAAETTIGRVLKDPELERGKRMCADGTIATIERRDLAARRIYVGSMRLADDDTVSFVAVGTTGDLVKRSTARFCGAVTGRAGSDVAMVGMFDLPENRTPLVEQ